MIDKPEIKVGQLWITTHGNAVRILADNAEGAFPFVGQYEGSNVDLWNANGQLGAINAEGEFTFADDRQREDLLYLVVGRL
jgi:hypothetical protein